MAVFFCPVVFNLSAAFPTPVLLIPFVLFNKAAFPNAVLEDADAVPEPIPTVIPFTFISYAPKSTA